MTNPDNRDSAGRFRPGTSGNPGGRRSKAPFRMHGQAAVEKIVWIMCNARNVKDQLDAAKYIADQAFGKATQGVELSGVDFVDKLTARIRAENPELAEQIAAIGEKMEPPP